MSIPPIAMPMAKTSSWRHPFPNARLTKWAITLGLNSSKSLRRSVARSHDEITRLRSLARTFARASAVLMLLTRRIGLMTSLLHQRLRSGSSASCSEARQIPKYTTLNSSRCKTPAHPFQTTAAVAKVRAITIKTLLSSPNSSSGSLPVQLSSHGSKAAGTTGRCKSDQRRPRSCRPQPSQRY